MENILCKYYSYKDTSELFPTDETIHIDINNNFG